MDQVSEPLLQFEERTFPAKIAVDGKPSGGATIIAAQIENGLANCAGVRWS
jgi:hypothetical protein